MAAKSSKQKLREEKARRKESKGADRNAIQDAPTLLLLGLAAILTILTCIAYANSFDGDFVYDDTKWVEQMSVDRSKSPLKSIMRARRPVVDMTLWGNFEVAEMKPAPRAMTVPVIPSTRGYHAVNLLIHVLAGLTLFGLIRRTIRVAPFFNERVQASAHWIAFGIAMLWLLHPLQTQSVTYIIQRAESLMGLFYLLMLYGLLRFATTAAQPLKSIWLFCTIVAAALGMGSKAVMVTAPVVALAYDRVFLAANWRELISKRWIAHAGITASLLVLVISGVVQGVLFPASSSKARSATVGFGLSDKNHLYRVTSFEYLLTEAKVIPRYLKLSALPIDQVLDYKMEKVDPNALSAGELFAESLLPGLLVLALLGGTIVALVKKPWLGFLGVWFFVILAPTSSIIPIRDPIYEHRMYLSLAAVLALFVAGVWWLVSRLGKEGLAHSIGPICAGVCLAPAIAFMVLTIQRNTLYSDPLALWEDNVAKVPDNWRARNNLAKQYLDEVDEHPEYVDNAIEHLTLAVANNDRFVNGWYNLGNAYSRKAKATQGPLESLTQYDNAIHAYQKALESNTTYTVAHIMLGNAYTDKANTLQQITRSVPQRASELRPEIIESLRQAALAFQAAAPSARRNTTNDRTLKARAFYNLGNTYWRICQLQADDEMLLEARSAYQKAIEAFEQHPSARIGIGLTYIRQKNYAEAARYFDEGIKKEFNPPANETRIALFQGGVAYLNLGNLAEALSRFESVTRRFPDFDSGWLMKGQTLEKLGRFQEALESYEQGAENSKTPAGFKAAINKVRARL